jgi:hypothetical protein
MAFVSAMYRDKLLQNRERWLLSAQVTQVTETGCFIRESDAYYQIKVQGQAAALRVIVYTNCLLPLCSEITL